MQICWPGPRHHTRLRHTSWLRGDQTQVIMMQQHHYCYHDCYHHCYHCHHHYHSIVV